MSHNRAWQVSFPALSSGCQQVFLNNRYGTQVPEGMIQSIMHALSTGITWMNDGSVAELQQRLAAFLHVDAPDGFFLSESEAGMIHWLAYAWGLSQLQDGDEVILSSQDAPMIKKTFDHIQQQMACQGRSLVISEFGYQENGEMDLDELLSLISSKTRLVFVPHIHAVFGTKNEDDIAVLKQRVGDQALVVVDLSQSVGRIPVHLERLRCDGAFFSGRDLFSPFPCGIGYLRPGLYTDQDSFLQRELTNPLVARTIIQGIDLLEHLGMQQIAHSLQELSQVLRTRLQQIDTLEFLPGLGRCGELCSPGYGIVSFQLPGVSAEECRLLLAENAVLVDLAALSRYPDAVTVSCHLYTTSRHIDVLVDCLYHPGQ